MKKLFLILITLIIGLSFTTIQKNQPSENLEGESAFYLLLKSNGEYRFQKEIKATDKAAVFVEFEKKPEIEKMKGKVESKELAFVLKSLKDEEYKIMMDVPCKCRDKNNVLVRSKWCGPGCIHGPAAKKFQKRFPHVHPNVACCNFMFDRVYSEFKKL